MKKSQPLKDHSNQLSEGLIRASVVFDEDAHKTLKMLGFMEGRSVSDIVREAVEQWLARNPKTATAQRERKRFEK